MDVAHSNVVLSLRGLKKSYGDLLAVDDLALDIFRGEVLGLLGPNGAGKTTTINIICGLLPCDAGEVILDGRSLKDKYWDCKLMIGLCPQEVVIWESLTCLEQLELVGRLYDVRPDVARNKAIELLRVFGLLDRKHKLARTLSAGMKRRLNLALALVHDPQMLILDEPQAELDPQSRILVREYIRSLGSGKTVLLSTHDMDEADRLADRIAIIDHGRLLVLDTSLCPYRCADSCSSIQVALSQLPGAFPWRCENEKSCVLQHPRSWTCESHSAPGPGTCA
jgi:ABC-2 type transport system ATP-binding protein